MDFAPEQLRDTMPSCNSPLLNQGHPFSHPFRVIRVFRGYRLRIRMSSVLGPSGGEVGRPRPNRKPPAARPLIRPSGTFSPGGRRGTPTLPAHERSGRRWWTPPDGHRTGAATGASQADGLFGPKPEKMIDRLMRSQERVTTSVDARVSGSDAQKCTKNGALTSPWPAQTRAEAASLGRPLPMGTEPGPATGARPRRTDFLPQTREDDRPVDTKSRSRNHFRRRSGFRLGVAKMRKTRAQNPPVPAQPGAKTLMACLVSAQKEFHHLCESRPGSYSDCGRDRAGAGCHGGPANEPREWPPCQAVDEHLISARMNTSIDRHADPAAPLVTGGGTSRVERR